MLQLSGEYFHSCSVNTHWQLKGVQLFNYAIIKCLESLNNIIRGKEERSSSLYAYMWFSKGFLCSVHASVAVVLFNFAPVSVRAVLGVVREGIHTPSSLRVPKLR